MSKKFYSLLLAAAALPAFAQAEAPQFAGLLSKTEPATEADVIWTPPCVEAGTSYTYTFEAAIKGFTRVGITDNYFDVSNGQKCEIVSNTRGDEYYIKNPLPRTAIGSYIVGTLVEDGDDLYIECQLPQWINARESTNTGVILSLGTPFTNTDGMTYYEPVTIPANNVIRYVLDEDENFVLQLPEGAAMAAFYSYLDEDIETVTFAGAAITYAKYCEVDDRRAPMAMPVGAEAEEWGMIYSNGEQAHTVTLGIEGDKVYIAGFTPDFPESCVVGTIDGETITFDAGQYVGETESTYEYLVFNKARFASTSDRGDVYTFEGSPLPSVQATYDADAKTISCALDEAWFCNAGTDQLYYSSYYVGPMFTINKGGAATPIDPEITEVMDYMPEFGYGGFIADMPLLGTEGQVLDKNNYTYIVYFDGEPYTFTPDIYPGVPVPMTEIPYDFEDGKAEDFRVEGTNHIICWRIDGYSKLGIQAVYTVDGERNTSNVVEYQLSSIGTLELPGTVSVEYFNLTGARVENPGQGIYIKRATMLGGKTVTTKVVVK